MAPYLSKQVVVGVALTALAVCEKERKKKMWKQVYSVRIHGFMRVDNSTKMQRVYKLDRVIRLVELFTSRSPGEAFQKMPFWPRIQPKDKKRESKEKLPSAVSSIKWIFFFKCRLHSEGWQSSRLLIKWIEKAKEERKLKLEANQTQWKEKIKPVKRKIMSSSSSSDLSLDKVLESKEKLYYEFEQNHPKINTISLAVGDFVVVRYEEDYYSGMVKSILCRTVFQIIGNGLIKMTVYVIILKMS